jgi:hypothetical protein
MASSVAPSDISALAIGVGTGVAVGELETEAVSSGPPPNSGTMTKIATSTSATTPSPMPPNSSIGLQLIFHPDTPRPLRTPRRPLRRLKLLLLWCLLSFEITILSFRN